MTRLGAWGAVISLVCLFGRAAYADDSIGVDEVTLKNGGTIRGTIVSVEPGSKVVIVEFGQKAPRTLTWAEVADVQKGKFATDGQPKAEPGPTGPGYDKPAPEEDEPERVAPSGTGVVKVHIESDEPVELYEHVGTSILAVGRYVAAVTHGRRICTSPCDLVVDGSRGQDFVVMGDGIPTSAPFRLRDRNADTTLQVDPGSNAGRWGGTMMISVGSAGIAAGALTMVLGAVLAGPAEYSEGYKISSAVDSTPFYVGGGVALGAGAGLLGGGIALAVTSGTKVEVTGGNGAGEARADGRFARDDRPAAIAPRPWLGEF